MIADHAEHCSAASTGGDRGAVALPVGPFIAGRLRKTRIVTHLVPVGRTVRPLV